MSHECQEHYDGKAMLVEFWRRRDFLTICEVGCDVLAWRVKDGRLQFVFSEFERSTRNVVRNSQRNQSQVLIGRARFLIVVKHERMRAAVRNVLRRGLSAEAARKVGITTIERIQQAIVRLQTSPAVESANATPQTTV